MSKNAFSCSAWQVVLAILIVIPSLCGAAAPATELHTEAEHLQVFNILEFPSQSSAVITWETSLPATSAVEYGMTQSLGMPPHFSGSLTTSHASNLTGLKPGQTYFYRVISETAGGEAVAEPDFPKEFTTTPDTGAAAQTSQTGGKVAKPEAETSGTSKASLEVNAEAAISRFSPALQIVSQECAAHHAPNLLEIAKPLKIQVITCCSQNEGAAEYKAMIRASISNKGNGMWAAKLPGRQDAASHGNYAGIMENITGSSHIEALRAINLLGRAAYYGMNATTSQPIYGTEQINGSAKLIQPAYYAALLYRKWLGTEVVKSSADAEKNVYVWAGRDSAEPEKLKLILINLGSQAAEASIKITGFTPKSGEYYEMTSPDPFSSSLTAINGFKIDADYRRALPSILGIKAKALAGIEHEAEGGTVKYSAQPHSATAIIISSAEPAETIKAKAGMPKPLSRPAANGQAITMAAKILSPSKNLTNLEFADISLAGPTTWFCAKKPRLKQLATAEYILFEVPAPRLSIASASGNSTAYISEFAITSENRLFNIDASLALNTSYSNWKLYALDGAEWTDITNLSSLKVSGSKAMFSGFSAYHQRFRIEGYMANSGECAGKSLPCPQPKAALTDALIKRQSSQKQFVVTAARQERPLTEKPETIKAPPLRRIEGKITIELSAPDEAEAGELYEAKIKLLSPVKSSPVLTVEGQNTQVFLEAGEEKEVSLTLRAPEAKGRFTLAASAEGSLATKAITIVYKPLFLYAEASKRGNAAQVNVTVKNYEDMLTELTIIRKPRQTVFSETMSGPVEFKRTFILNYAGNYQILAKAFSKGNTKEAAESDEYTLAVEAENPSKAISSAVAGFAATMAGSLVVFWLLFLKIRQRL